MMDEGSAANQPLGGTEHVIAVTATALAVCLVLSAIVGVSPVAGATAESDNAATLTTTASDPTGNLSADSNTTETDNVTAPPSPRERLGNDSRRLSDPRVPFPSIHDDVSITAYVTARLSTGSDGTLRADFTGGSRHPTVRSVSFATEPVDTVVRTAEYSGLPSTLDAPRAEIVSTTAILVPPSLEAADATITAGIDRAAIPPARSPEDLVVLRRADGDWQPLTTRVVESSSSEVVIETETPGFSYFTVVADDGTVEPGTLQQVVGPADNGSTTATGPTATNESLTDTESTANTESTTETESATNTDSAADTEPTTDESPTLGLAGVVGSLVLASLLLARRGRRTSPK